MRRPRTLPTTEARAPARTQAEQVEVMRAQRKSLYTKLRRVQRRAAEYRQTIETLKERIAVLEARNKELQPWTAEDYRFWNGDL